MIFFELNNERRIGFKKLSQADLGLNSTSNQTHIGLYERVLTFLDNSDVVSTAMLIHNDYCDIVSCNFDRIENPDGSFRSPKIKMGNNRNDSVVVKIREFAAAKPMNNWYLIWFGLDSDELVFWLICDDSLDYQVVKDIFLQGPRVIDQDNPDYKSVASLLRDKINNVTHEIQKDLEVASQTGNRKRNYRPRDIEKAQNLFKATGFLGEQMVAVYLDQLKCAGEISSFKWMNANGESGAPFDFIVNESMSQENFIDVKSTRFGFSQPVIFSSQEINFVANRESDEQYSVFRVFNIQDIETKLRICNKCLNYMQILNKDIIIFKNAIAAQKSYLTGADIAVDPLSCFGYISDNIVLPKM